MNPTTTLPIKTMPTWLAHLDETNGRKA